MKANELMIGDWIYINPWDDQEPTYPNRVTGIHYNSWEGADYCDWVDCEVWDEISLDEIRPIPMTAEILEQNGFIKDEEKDTDVTYHLLVLTGLERNSFTVQVTLYKEPICGVNTLVKCWGWIPPQNGGINDIHLCSADYVHQLQHALRLCGIEKEIIIKEE